MADEADLASDLQESFNDAAIKAAAKPIPPGTPGECDYCGKHFSRLIGGACGRCRDEHHLP
jgi:hypothetical protein